MKGIKLHTRYPILGFDREVVIASNGNLILPYLVELPEINIVGPHTLESGFQLFVLEHIIQVEIPSGQTKVSTKPDHSSKQKRCSL